MQEHYAAICAGQDIRAHLIELKKCLRQPAEQEKFRRLTGGSFDVIMKCLADEDPKARKNAAAILGILKCREALDVLWDAYVEEDKLFVRSEYVDAMAALKCDAYLEQFRERLADLESREVPENERKHVREEIDSLRRLLLEHEGIPKHQFTGWQQINEIYLSAPAPVCPLLYDSLEGKKRQLKTGVRLETSDLSSVTKNRLWQEMLFLLHGSAPKEATREEITAMWQSSGLEELLIRNHDGDFPFYFRLSITGMKEGPEKTARVKTLAQSLEQTFPGRLINSPSHYELEVRLAMGKEKMTPFVKLMTLPDHRFDYRKYHVAASMRPSMAAALMALATPYLKESAQVLDPFCGVGTLLIERRFASPVRSAYGIDTFGEAIEKGRRNAAIAKMPVNFINRDFFDFTHEYLFDEIITDMPAGNLPKQELDELYRKFFHKAAQVLSDKGRIFCYSREMGLIKKYLRIGGEFRLLKEICIREKTGIWFFILEKKGKE